MADGKKGLTRAAGAGIREPSGRFSPGSSGNPAGRPVRLAELREAARRTALRDIEVLEQIRDDPKSPPSVRAAAADRLLQWGFGGPAANLGDGRAPEPGFAGLRDEQLQALLGPVDEAEMGDVLDGEFEDSSAVPYVSPFADAESVRTGAKAAAAAEAAIGVAAAAADAVLSQAGADLPAGGAAGPAAGCVGAVIEPAVGPSGGEARPAPACGLVGTIRGFGSR